MNVDLTNILWPTEERLRGAIAQAGDLGSITIAPTAALQFANAMAAERTSQGLQALSADLLKAVVLQGAARAAIPVPEDVRALVRLAREMYSELATPTTWPVPKAEPEDDEE